MIPRDLVDQIMDVAIIEEVIGEFVHLKKSGSSFRGLSPFTNEKTPSFYVIPSKGIFKDFSSGKGGSVVTFLMEHEKMTFPEALRWLAQRYGIEIEEEKPSEEVLQERSERESLLAVTEWAARYFEDCLWNTPEGKTVGYGYLNERGFRDDTIKKFRLGYCPEGWDSMTKAATEAGYELQWLKAAGLTRESNGKHYDFFRERVMFPIQDVSGRVIAFGGRILKSDKKTAKYYNSPENALYNKSRVLYGIYQARQAIAKADRCLLVEGYTDVTSLHQAGAENAVASSGTALTVDQIKLIKRYTPNVSILYDGDAAGIRASFRGINMILAEGLNVKVVLFPDGEDPDSFASRVSQEELERYISEEAKDFMSFKTELLSKEAGGDPIKRAEMIREVVESIAFIPDAIKRSVYIQQCSKLLDVDEQILLSETNKQLQQRQRQGIRREAQTPPPNEAPPVFLPETAEKTGKPKQNLLAQERDFLRLLLNFGKHPLQLSMLKHDEAERERNEEVEVSVAEYLLMEFREEGFTLHDAGFEETLKVYEAALEGGRFPSEHDFLRHENQAVVRLCSDLLADPYVLSENWSARHRIYPETEEMNLAKATKDCVYRLKLHHVLAMINELQEALKSPMDDDQLMETLKRRKQLDTIKKELSEYFGSTIL